MAKSCCKPIRNGIYSAIVRESQLARLIVLGRYADRGVHPVPAFDFTKPLPQENIDLSAVNFKGDGQAHESNSPPPPLAEQIKPYLKSPGEGLDFINWFNRVKRLCREADLEVTFNTADFTGQGLDAVFALVDGEIRRAIAEEQTRRAKEQTATPSVEAAGPIKPVGRKPRGRYAKLELTERQTEAVEQLGIHKTKTKAALAMGISRAAFDKSHAAAMKKLGKLAPKKKPRTEQFAIDRRGQNAVSADHRFD